MIDVEVVAHAIMMVESNGVTNAIGDSGQALGAFQFHPAAFWDWADKPHIGQTWSQWFFEAACRFIECMARAFPNITEREIAVVYHQHCYIRRADHEDMIKDDYAERFDAAVQRLG